MAKIKTFFINGDELDVGVPSSLSVDTLNVGDNISNDGEVKINGADATLRVGAASDIGAVRINAGGTTPNVQVGKSGRGDYPCIALSCNSSGHGLLILDNISFDAASLSATYAANTLLEGLV